MKFKFAIRDMITMAIADYQRLSNQSISRQVSWPSDCRHWMPILNLMLHAGFEVLEIILG